MEINENLLLQTQIEILQQVMCAVIETHPNKNEAGECFMRRAHVLRDSHQLRYSNLMLRVEDKVPLMRSLEDCIDAWRGLFEKAA